MTSSAIGTGDNCWCAWDKHARLGHSSGKNPPRVLYFVGFTKKDVNKASQRYTYSWSPSIFEATILLSPNQNYFTTSPSLVCWSCPGGECCVCIGPPPVVVHQQFTLLSSDIFCQIIWTCEQSPFLRHECVWSSEYLVISWGPRVFVQVIIRDLREIWLQPSDEEFSSLYLRHD